MLNSIENIVIMELTDIPVYRDSIQIAPNGGAILIWQKCCQNFQFLKTGYKLEKTF